MLLHLPKCILVKDLEAQLEAKVKGKQLQTQKELEEQLEIRLKERRQQAKKERLQYLEKFKGIEHMCRIFQEKVMLKLIFFLWINFTFESNALQSHLLGIFICYVV